MHLICQKCLSNRTGDVLGGPCKTPGCGGVIERLPDFKELVDILPEPMTCGRRYDIFAGAIPVHKYVDESQDYWQRFKTNGDRVCSFCGSLHPDDFFRMVKAAAEAPESAGYNEAVGIEPSDKGYKIYVHQPGVRNAHEGGIKFYTQHIPRNADNSMAVTQEQQDEYARAVRATKARI